MGFAQTVIKAILRAIATAAFGYLVGKGYLDAKNADPAHIEKLVGFIATLLTGAGTLIWTWRHAIGQRIRMLTGFGMPPSSEHEVDRNVKAGRVADAKTPPNQVPSISAGSLFR